MRYKFALLCLFLFVSCQQLTQKKRELNDVDDLVAVLNSEEKKLYVKVGLEDTLLQQLGAKRVEETNLYEATIKGGAVQFEVVSTKTPYAYSPDVFGSFHESKFLLAKIYLNAQCGKLNQGFTSNCIGTFGPHRAFGNSMTWQVKDWHSCTRGDSICIEVWKQVGTITYYPDANCSDTIFVTRKIMRFRCD